MYSKPMVARFGSFRDLTQAGCFGATDSFSVTVPGIGSATSVGSTMRFAGGTIDLCLEPNSR